MTQKTMPFIMDAVHPSPEPPMEMIQTDSLRLGSPPQSSSPHRPQRSQSTTSILSISPRLPPTVPEEGAVSPQELPAGSPRRARNTSLSKPRASGERLPDDDANWWTEEIHKRREIRRRWREAEDENTVVIGSKVDTNHPNYVTAYNMLTGLRVAVIQFAFLC
jgi:1-phosphatidylinositol-4-phosphate 5-kinase